MLMISQHVVLFFRENLESKTRINLLGPSSKYPKLPLRSLTLSKEIKTGLTFGSTAYQCANWFNPSFDFPTIVGGKQSAPEKGEDEYSAVTIIKEEKLSWGSRIWYKSGSVKGWSGSPICNGYGQVIGIHEKGDTLDGMEVNSGILLPDSYLN